MNEDVTWSETLTWPLGFRADDDGSGVQSQHKKQENTKSSSDENSTIHQLLKTIWTQQTFKKRQHETNGLKFFLLPFLKVSIS